VSDDADGDEELSLAGDRASPSRDPLPATPARVAAALKTGPLVGQVRGLESTTAPHWSNHQETVLSFFVERFDEEGDRILLVPVELRGLKIRGVLREGSRVEVSGRRRSGTVRAKRIVDLDTQAEITGEGIPAFVKVLIAVIVVVIVVGLIVG
jgi:hypothetical protein